MNTFIKCYKKLYLENKEYLNEEQSPCNSCFDLLKCYDLEKLVKTINKEKKKLKKKEKKNMKIILSNQYLNDITIEGE